MKAHFPGSVFLRTLSLKKKRKKDSWSCSRGSRAVDVKEMDYESEEREVLLFCSYNQSFFGCFRFFRCRGCLSFQMLGDGKAR